MKVIYITLTLVLLTNFTQGQSNNPDPLDPITHLAQIKQVNFSSTYERFQFTNTPVYNSFGISIEGMISKHFGFEVGISGGKDNFQTGIGVLALPFMIKARNSSKEDPTDFEKWIKPALLAILLLEHINYHIDITQDFQLIPYVSLIRLRYMYNPEMDPLYNKNYVFLSGAVGIKAGLTFKDKWLLNAYCERSQLYFEGNPSGIQAGLNLGILLK